MTLSIPEDPVNREFERIGCRVIPAPLNRHGMNPLAELRLLCEYRRLCREIRPDVIFIEQFLGRTPEQRRAMGLAGRCLVEECFDREFTIAAYLEGIRVAVTGHTITISHL